MPDEYGYDPAMDYGALQAAAQPTPQTIPTVTTAQVPVGGLSYTASGEPYATDPNMTEADYLAALASAPPVNMPSTTATQNYMAAARNPGLPAHLQYTPITQTLNAGYDPKAAFSLPAGSEFTMTDQERNDAYVNWLRENQQYQTKNWMIQTAPTGYGGSNMALQSGTPYVLRNNETGEIIAQGSDDATLERIAGLISGGSLGDKWQLFEPGQSAYGNLTAGLSPADAAFAGNTGYGNSEYVEGTNGQPGYWLNPVAGARPAPSTVGQFLKTALTTWGAPIGAAYLAPALGGGILGAAGAGAVAGGATSAITGGDILKGALLGGGAGAAMSALGSALGPATSVSGGGSGGGGSGGAPTGGDPTIVVTGGGGSPVFTPPPAVLASNTAQQQQQGPLSDPTIVVTGGGGSPVFTAPPGVLGMGASALAGLNTQMALDIAAQQQAEQQAEEQAALNEIVVTGARPSPSPILAPSAPDVYRPITDVNPAVAALQNQYANDFPDPNEIVVVGNTNPAVPALPTIPNLTTPITGGTPAETPAADKSTLDKIVDYLQLGSLGLGLGSTLLGGGGGSGALAKIPGGLGSGSGIYSAKLPTPGQGGAFTVGGLGGGTGAGGATGSGRVGGTAPAGGWSQYGAGPGGAGGSSFASLIPQYGGVNPPGFDTDTWRWLGPQLANAPMLDTSRLPVRMAHGGYAVGGPGDGRSDEIPAMLSDGEYVIDAETVALLGNGSNKAGAQQLDRFRANIRKHKGRELARGDFSVNAKRPETYLSGGRS